MKAAWYEQQQRWLRFEAWENERLRSASRDFAEALAWMSDAWELAGRVNPSWNSRESAEAHWRHLADLQRRLARARLGT
jgi:hypothetical protein